MRFLAYLGDVRIRQATADVGYGGLMRGAFSYSADYIARTVAYAVQPEWPLPSRRDQPGATLTVQRQQGDLLKELARQHRVRSTKPAMAPNTAVSVLF